MQKQKLKKGILISLLIFISSFSLSHYFPAKAEEESYVEIYEDTVWRKEDNLVFDKPVYVYPGATLTIEKGARITFVQDSEWSGGYLSVGGGRVIAEGTPEEPIKITSSNPHSYHLLEFYYDKWDDFPEAEPSLFRHVEISGGGLKYDCPECDAYWPRLIPTAHATSGIINGWPAVYFTGGKVKMENCRFYDNDYADVMVDYWQDEWNAGSYLEIVNSNFSDNLNNTAVISEVYCSTAGCQENEKVILRNNWYGSANGPSLEPDFGSNGEKVIGDFTLDGFSAEEWNFLAQGNSNIMFLPGIKASKLYKQGSVWEDQLWPPNYFGSDLDELAMDENGHSVNSIYTRDIIKEVGAPWLGSNIYKTFVEDLDSLKGDGTINDYNLFAYDWRQNVENVAKYGTLYPEGDIKSAVTELKALAENAKNKKVTIVAHSMGGLLAKAIMQELEESGETDKVDKIVFVSTPQMGTPKSILSLFYGYDEGSPLGMLISRQEARKLGENMLSAYGLLPSEEYFERTETSLINFSSENTRYKKFKNAYGESIGSFEEFEEFLTGEDDEREKPSDDNVEMENVLRKNILEEAQEMHERLDSWTPPSNVEVIEIAGWGLDTVGGIDYTEREKVRCYAYPGSHVPLCTGTGEYEPVYEPKFTVDGDKVVTAPSSLMMEESENVKRYWVDLYRYNTDPILFNSNQNHGNILEMDPVKEFIKSVITDTDYSSSLSELIKTSRPEDYDDAKPRIRMSLYSPLDIHLYDDEGNHTGPKTVVDEKGNEGTIIEEAIPNSYYYHFGDRKYVGIPSGENIRVEMDGYADGAYTLHMQEIEVTDSGEEETYHTTFANLPVSSDTSVALSIPETGLEELSDLQADFDGDGEDDYAVTPVPNGEATLTDMIPPETEIEISGTEGSNDWYVSDVLVTLVSEDNADGSGMEKTSYSLDGGASWQNYVEPIMISEEKITDFQYFSVDKEGNEETVKSQIIKIDKTAPEAKMIFNEEEQKLDIIGIDNLSSNVAVTQEERTIIEETEKEESKRKDVFSRIFGIIKKEKKKKIIVTATLTDEAGHKTEVVYEKKKDKNRRIDISLESVSYDDVKTDFSKSRLQYKWLLNWRKDKYVLFGTHIRNDNETLEAHYRPRKNETWIMERSQELDDDDNDDDVEKRSAWKKLQGMVVPYIQTEKGKIKIEY